MKPGTKPYDRNSKQWQTIETANPCNDFIVEFLVRTKIKVDKQGLNQYYCYNLAIQSVKKYPLPIICETQLTVIEGFGDFFKSQTMKLIKKHYGRGRLPTTQEKREDQAEQNQSLRLNIKSINEKKVKKRSKKVYKSDSEIQDYSNIQDINALQSQLESRFEGSSYSVGSKSNNSSSRAYKPKPGTQPYQILEIMKNLKADEKPITRGQINEYLYEKCHEKMKLWHITRSKLRDHGYIEIDDRDNDFLHLTNKGLKYIEGSSNKCTTNQKKTHSKKKGTVQKSIEPSKKYFKKEPIPPPLNPKDTKILVNNHSFTQEQIDQIQSHLKSIKHSHFQVLDLSVGDFLWEIQGQLADIIMKRINLANFDENQFRDTCYRLKSTQAKEIIVLAQLSEQDRKQITEEDKSLMEFNLAKCKVTRIKIIRTKGLTETLGVIEKYRKILINMFKSIVNGIHILSLGSVQEYNRRNILKNPNILRNIFIGSLRTFPCIHVKTIQGIVQKLPCFRILYDKLEQLENNSERVQFLMWLLKSHNPKKGIIYMLVDFLFLNEYKEQLTAK